MNNIKKNILCKKLDKRKDKVHFNLQLMHNTYLLVTIMVCLWI